MVVIAEAGESALFRFEISQNFGDRFDILRFVRNVIARQHEHIGFQTIGDLDGAPDVIEISERAVMNVRKMQDAKAVQLFRICQIKRTIASIEIADKEK